MHIQNLIQEYQYSIEKIVYAFLDKCLLIVKITLLEKSPEYITIDLSTRTQDLESSGVMLVRYRIICFLTAVSACCMHPHSPLTKMCLNSPLFMLVKNKLLYISSPKNKERCSLVNKLQTQQA